eukprot:404120-Rhodomonas_salina.4
MKTVPSDKGGLEKSAFFESEFLNDDAGKSHFSFPRRVSNSCHRDVVSTEVIEGWGRASRWELGVLHDATSCHGVTDPCYHPVCNLHCGHYASLVGTC